MSDLVTKVMLNAFVERKDAHKPGFFTSFFTENVFHNSSVVELDVVRAGQKIAPVIKPGTGNHRTETKKFSNNEWEPPVYGLEFSLDAYDAMKRIAGEDPYKDPNFLANIQKQFNSHMPECELMIRRAVELQAVQALKTGTLTLPDKDGNTGHTVDYQARSTHKLVAATVDWDETSNVVRLTDVRNLCNVVFNDSGLVPRYMIMGELARESWFADDNVQKQTRKDGTGIGEQVPPQLRNGGSFHGRSSVGQFVLEIWSCNGFYESVHSGTPIKYLGDWEVIIVGENASLTMTWGGIPRIAPADPRLSSMSIGRVSSTERMIDLNTNAWFSLDGTQLFGSVGARPLAVPKSLDGFASLNCKVT